MNRHEGVICNGCMKDNFNGRCYRCLTCRDFDLCADCYDRDFTTAEHLYDHPVKCIFTQADIELYFGGEYINSDPPQSYRCPYCKEWGFNESMFLGHISDLHPRASPQLVSTIVNLFEQQQAARIFLEEEQLAAFAATTNSRNHIINRQIGLELILRPLNSDGSYRNDDSNHHNGNGIDTNLINRTNQLITQQRNQGRRGRSRGCNSNNGNSSTRTRISSGSISGAPYVFNRGGSQRCESGRHRGGGDSVATGVDVEQSDAAIDFGNINRSNQRGGILQLSLPPIPEHSIRNAQPTVDGDRSSISISERLRLTFSEADRQRVNILMSHTAEVGIEQESNGRCNGLTRSEQPSPLPATAINSPTRSFGVHNPALTEVMRYYSGRINALVTDNVALDNRTAGNNTNFSASAENSARNVSSTNSNARNRSGRVRMHLGTISLQQRNATNSDDMASNVHFQCSSNIPTAFGGDVPRTFLSLANQTAQNNWSNSNATGSRSRVIRLSTPYHNRSTERDHRNVSSNESDRNFRFNGDIFDDGITSGSSIDRTTAAIAAANENSRNVAFLRTIEEEIRALEGIRLRHNTLAAFDVNANNMRQAAGAVKPKALPLNTVAADDKKQETAQRRFLLRKYLQPRSDRRENYTRFLTNRAEFVSQLLMSAMCDDELVLPERLISENFLSPAKVKKSLKRQSTTLQAAVGAAGDAGAGVVEQQISNENAQNTLSKSSSDIIVPLQSDNNEAAYELKIPELDE